jgi:diguanylate cyclase (GGDEF)-like protein
MEKRLSRRIIIGMSVLIALAVFAQLCFHLNVYWEKRINHDKVAKLIDQDLMFRWETMDEDLEFINNWIADGHFYNEDLGRLYERASLIYMQKGEIMPYYKYLGYALYYLERSSEKDYTVNVYLDLANFFLNNYASDSARRMVEAATAIEDFDEIENLQVKSYAFRMLGIMAILDNDFDKAEANLEKAQEVVALSNTGIFEECYKAIDDVWLGRVYVETGRFDECSDKLDQWEGNPMFSQDIYRQILLRDLIIPFYQVKFLNTAAIIYQDADSLSKEELLEREEKVGAVFNEFMDICEENGYKKTELYTLLKMQKEYPPVSEEALAPMYENLDRLYNELFNEQNITYANLIDSTVLNSINEMEEIELQERSWLRRRRLFVMAAIVIAIVLTTLLIFLLYSRLDGLTKLLNRKAFNRAISRAKVMGTPYSLIMIDIDHFKQINDTYGHQNGDVVLSRIGELMQVESNMDIHCYRYGGEELVVLLERKSAGYAKTIADRLRANVESQKWTFDEKLVITISGGVASGSGDTDVLKHADESLYHAKESGRNRIMVYGVDL